ncbi:MAG: tyrosine-protein phosphatase [Tannerellaceae bacterium]|jgi:protein-tyrosine phosphatase|nr:tyrosine-protein phosphatase [Tannerellaceae bacterium]
MKSFFIYLSFIAAMVISSCANKQSPDHPLYKGKDLSGIAEITRDKDTKETTFTIRTDKNWKLYGGGGVEAICYKRPLLKGKEGGTFTLSVSNTRRHYYQLITEEGKTILSERHLPMAGGFNFRDLGGYRTKDGHFVKWGKIFRSDDLHSLTENDLNYLSSIPLVSIVDFRSETEMTQAPDKIPASVKKDYPFPITPGNLTAANDLSALENLNLDSVMMEINKQLVTDPVAIKRYKDFFTLLQNEEEIPLMFHCSAGKDRTGMGAALILLGLGVEEETVLQDYLLSNTYLKDKYASPIEKFPSLQPLFTVKAAFLQAGLDQLKKTYGSIENYLEGALGVDIAKFREMYLDTVQP